MDQREKAAHLDHVTEVFRILREADLMLDSCPLLWHVDDDGRLQLAVNCSDTFAWGCADCESIGPDDVPLLRQCLADLKAADGCGEIWLAELYCCRKRAMRPMNVWIKRVPPRDDMPQCVLDLILAAGPDRESTFTAP
jgi:hypothetical protein